MTKNVLPYISNIPQLYNNKTIITEERATLDCESHKVP